jgi:hypothetical protein
MESTVNFAGFSLRLRQKVVTSECSNVQPLHGEGWKLGFGALPILQFGA